MDDRRMKLNNIQYQTKQTIGTIIMKDSRSKTIAYLLHSQTPSMEISKHFQVQQHIQYRIIDSRLSCPNFLYLYFRPVNYEYRKCLFVISTVQDAILQVTHTNKLIETAK